jgi:ComF family protein
MAQYYFTPKSLLQQLMHQLKYKGQQQLGRQLGRLMGESLINANWIFIDALIPLPLFPEKEKLRGYNQATVLCEGIAEKMNIPILHNAIIRPAATETQTRKNRVERWQNMEGRFRLDQPALVEHKHVLLIDDVITTGATLEACGIELLKADGVELSVASLAYADRN